MIGLHHARRGVPGGHRRRGALRRPRPFRPRADPDRMACRRAAGADAQLSRARARSCSPIRRRSRTRSSCCIRTGRCCRWSLLATAATVIASQAVITGAYSLTHRRSSSACCRGSKSATPRRRMFGQIYMPRVNTLLLIGVLLLVAAVPLVERARLRLRHRGHRHDGGDRHDGLRRDLEGVELVAWLAAAR